MLLPVAAGKIGFDLAADPDCDPFPVERRTRIRFHIDLPVRYRTLHTKLEINGLGRSVNISSHGIMILSSCIVPAGARVEVRFPWPTELGGTVALQLVASGKVVRAERTGFAVEITSHEFRTLKRLGESEFDGVAPPDAGEHDCLNESAWLFIDLARRPVGD